ncbi:MAG: hypothetical protein BMS9Abin39_0599 [Ignavibacteria bacterium]|nr:MAG: hypothetical protein BMS9Abin39_0599 [Ignavibacteria bacterium]
MKAIILALLLIPLLALYSQDYNHIKNFVITDNAGVWETVQSIDFDDSSRTVFGLSRVNDSASIVRYDIENWEEWNLTNLFDLYFTFIITDIDHQGNYLALQGDTLYKFDGINWTTIQLPNVYGGVRYAHITEDTYNNIWISIYLYGLGSTLFKISDTTVTDYTSYFPAHPFVGEVYAEGDSIWICSTEGLGLLYNDQLQIFNLANSAFPTQKVYSFHIDSQGQRWIGSIDKGLIKWVDDSTFVLYNSSNTGLTNDFINAIAEDSYGNIWFATDNGFASLIGEKVTVYPFFDRSVVALEIDQNNIIWLGTASNGLYFFDGNDFLYITAITEETSFPFEYNLAQNYPNPFNPTTNIEFRIAELGLVTLKIYDILGNEIGTLVNEEKPAGSYTVEFSAIGGDAYSLPSGIYFYQLRAGNFVETKNMILMK